MFKYRMSVIVPVYNCEDYLASCLDSLLRQTISKDELEVLLTSWQPGASPIIY